MILTSGRSCLIQCFKVAQLDDLRTSNGLNGTSHNGKGDKELGDLHFEKIECVYDGLCVGVDRKWIVKIVDKVWK